MMNRFVMFTKQHTPNSWRVLARRAARLFLKALEIDSAEVR